MTGVKLIRVIANKQRINFIACWMFSVCSILRIVIPNLFRHLSIQRTVEMLKQVQHDDNLLTS